MYVVWVVFLYTFAWSQFIEIETFPKTCVYARVAPFSDSKISNETFEECYNGCRFDDNCNFFSHFKDNCMKAVMMELTDNFNASKLYFSRNTTTFKKQNGVDYGYYSQLCNNYFNKKGCNSNVECSWRKGLIGYNREARAFKNPLGYCGRIRCLSS